MIQKTVPVSVTSLKLVPLLDDTDDRCYIPDEPAVKMVYRLGKCNFLQSKKYQVFLARGPANEDQSLDCYEGRTKKAQKEDRFKQDGLEGAFEANVVEDGTLQSKENNSNGALTCKRLAFSEPFCIRCLQTCAGFSLMSSMFYCLLGLPSFEGQIKKIGPIMLPDNSLSLLKQIQEQYRSPGKQPIKTKKLTQLLSTFDYSDCRDFWNKFAGKIKEDYLDLKRIYMGEQNITGEVKQLRKGLYYQSIFQGEFRRASSCGFCRFTRFTTKPFSSIRMWEGIDVNVKDYLQTFRKRIHIEEKCSRCKVLQKICLTTTINKLPKVLVVCIDKKNKLTKISQSLVLADKDLNLDVKFQLQAVVQEGLNKKYTCVFKTGRHNSWIKAAGSDVCPVKDLVLNKFDGELLVMYQSAFESITIRGYEQGCSPPCLSDGLTPTWRYFEWTSTRLFY